MPLRNSKATSEQQSSRERCIDFDTDINRNSDTLTESNALITIQKESDEVTFIDSKTTI